MRAVLSPVNSALGCMHGAVRAVLMQAGSMLGRAVAPRNAHCAVLPVRLVKGRAVAHLHVICSVRATL